MFQELATELLTKPEIYTGKFYPIKCDLRQENDIREAFHNIKTNIGPIAILINNAAYMGPHQALLGSSFRLITNYGLEPVSNHDLVLNFYFF